MRPGGNAQISPQLVGPPKVTQQWRTKKPANMREKPAEDMGANKPNAGEYGHQVPEQSQLSLAICEEQIMVSNKEISNVDQLIQKSPELSCIREFPALSTSVQRLSNVTVKTGGIGNFKSLPTTESGPPILSQ